MSLAVRKSRISELSVAGRLPPAQHAYAETLSDESFAAFVATLPESQKPAPATPSLSLTPLPNGAGHGGASVPASTVKLTVEELEMAKKFGQNPDDMLSVKAELNAGANFFQYTPKSPANTLVTK
jgi:phage I-like protein